MRKIILHTLVICLIAMLPISCATSSYISADKPTGKFTQDVLANLLRKGVDPTNAIVVFSGHADLYREATIGQNNEKGFNKNTGYIDDITSQSAQVITIPAFEPIFYIEGKLKGKAVTDAKTGDTLLRPYAGQVKQIVVKDSTYDVTKVSVDFIVKNEKGKERTEKLFFVNRTVKKPLRQDGPIYFSGKNRLDTYERYAIDLWVANENDDPKNYPSNALIEQETNFLFVAQKVNGIIKKTYFTFDANGGMILVPQIYKDFHITDFYYNQDAKSNLESEVGRSLQVGKKTTKE